MSEFGGAVISVRILNSKIPVDIILLLKCRWLSWNVKSRKVQFSRKKWMDSSIVCLQIIDSLMPDLQFFFAGTLYNDILFIKEFNFMEEMTSENITAVFINWNYLLYLQVRPLSKPDIRVRKLLQNLTILRLKVTSKFFMAS